MSIGMLISQFQLLGFRLGMNVDDATENLLAAPADTGGSSCGSVHHNITKKEIVPGWDATGWDIYKEKVVSLAQTGVMNTTVYPPNPLGVASFFVSKDECHNRNFWSNLSKGGWERLTFNIFKKYINPGKTVVVDFGAWIGPTVSLLLALLLE